MKPLLTKDLGDFLKRFDNFRDAEFRHVQIISPTIITITLAVQDRARAFDWITITLEFSGVIDAVLIDNSKLNMVDLSDGISILHEDNKFYFGTGDCKTISNIKSSTCHIVGSTLKYQEGSF